MCPLQTQQAQRPSTGAQLSLLTLSPLRQQGRPGASWFLTGSCIGSPAGSKTCHWSVRTWDPARDLLFIPPTEDVKPADSCSRRDPSRPNLGCCRQGSLPVCQECILLFEGASLPACWLPWERSAGIPECCFSEPQEEPKEKGTFTKGPFLGTPDSLVCRSWTPPCELLLIFNFQRFT